MQADPRKMDGIGIGVDGQIQAAAMADNDNVTQIGDLAVVFGRHALCLELEIVDGPFPGYCLEDMSEDGRHPIGRGYARHCCLTYYLSLKVEERWAGLDFWLDDENS